MEKMDRLIPETTEKMELQSKIRVCPKCNTNLGIQIEILGKVRIMPVNCKCEKERLAEKKANEAAEEKQKKLTKLKQYSLMDTEFYSCTFENWDFTKGKRSLYNIGKNYVDRWPEMKEKNIGLMLHGIPGVGKSYLSFCIANALLQKHVPVIAISSIALLEKVRDSYTNFGDEGERRLIKTLENADLLIIDDLGAEHTKEWGKSILYSIIDSRMREEKPLIVTTNVSEENLKLKLTGEDGVLRTYDRLIAMCNPISLTGESNRKIEAKGKNEIIRTLLNET